MFKQFLIGALISPFFVLAVMADEFDDKLKVADELRSQNVNAFRDALDALSPDASKFSPEQTQYFNYLNAYSLSYAGKLLDAIPLYEGVFASSLDYSLKLRAKNSILNNYALVRDFPKALQQIPDMVPLLSRANETDKNLAILTIALFYNQLEDFEQSLVYTNRVVNSNLSSRNRCMAHNLRSESLHYTGKLDLETLQTAIDICTVSKEPIPLNLSKLWKAQLMLGDPQQAAQALDDLIAIQADVEGINYPRLTAEYYTTLAQVYLANRYFNNARDSALKGAELAKGMGHSRPMKSAYYVLFEAAKAEGNSNEALNAYIQYAEADKAYLDEHNIKQMAIQQAKFDSLEKNIEIQLLDKENSLLKAQADLSSEEKQNHLLLITLLASTTILVFMWGIINRKLHIALREKAQTDSLTKISNRHYFTELALKSLKQAKDTNEPLTFVIFDLDHFKSVNDSYGHPVGDWVLKAVIDSVKPNIRREDILGRLGGEEFGLLLPGCPERRAFEIANAMRQRISEINTAEAGHVFDISASFGIASTLTSNAQFESLYANADEALYESKRNGRNKVSVYRPVPEIAAVENNAAAVLSV